jgi:hypothetical protein
MYRPCNAKNCERIIKGNSVYCSKHKRVFGHHGDADFVHQRLLTLKQRFDQKYQKCPVSGCWNWTGSTNQSGYGTMAPNEWGTLAHRISYGLNVGPVPKGKGPHGTCVCHRCDNRLCVNPEHLFLGSNADNLADRDAKGRQVAMRGSRNGHSKLNESDIVQIRAMFHRGAKLREVAERFSISKANASDIKRGKIWAHVKDIA